MAIEEEPAPGIPEWVVTFGDMMSLLLTFFIMLVSMSEIKEEERFAAMLESMRRQFGHDSSMASIVPGEMTNATTSLPEIAIQARARRKDLMRGGADVQAVTGENTRVQQIRPGRNSTTGGKVYFAEDAAELTERAKAELDEIARQLAGKPQKLEIRGHTSRKPVDASESLRDHWDLAYDRCYAVMQYLISQGIEPERIRLGSAGAFEPLNPGDTVEDRKQNARVEILMWDERVVAP
jgi:chemotaxis protein MotB